MFAHERHTAILDALNRSGQLAVPLLGQMLGASPATVRRDLKFLEESGQIARTHGGVHLPRRGAGEISFDRKGRRELAAKIALARAAAGSVKPGETLFIDSGTTALKLGVELVQRHPGTIYTNSIPLLNETPGPACQLIGIGGQVRSVSRALTGAGAMAWLDRIRFDAAFVGASGIDPLMGPCTTELTEMSVKRAVIRNARRAVLLADASKWTETAPLRFAEWKDLDEVYSDHALTAAEERIFAQSRVQFHFTRK